MVLVKWISILFFVFFVFLERSSAAASDPPPPPPPLSLSLSSLGRPQSPPDDEGGEGETGAVLLLRNLFAKYGGNGVMTFEGFEHLMENIGLGNVEISDHDVHDHQMHAGGFREFHEDHRHHNSSSSSSSTGEEEEEEHAMTINSPSAAAAAAADARSEEQVARTTTTTTDRAKKKNKNRKKQKHHHHQQQQEEEDDDGESGAAVGGRGGGGGRGRREKRWSVVYVEQKCVTPTEILSTFDIEYSDGISPKEFASICPAIIYQLDQHFCHFQHPTCDDSFGHSGRETHCSKYHDQTNDTKEATTNNPKASKVWLYSCLSVAVISVVGLLAAGVLPFVDRLFFFSHLLQFLIALAVGTLTGDALMHLLPHAMTPQHGGHSSDGESSSSSSGGISSSSCSSSATESRDFEGASEGKGPVWVGFVSLFGIFLFFVVERILTIYSDKRKMRKRRTEQRISRRSEEHRVGERLCQSPPDPQEDAGDLDHSTPHHNDNDLDDDDDRGQGQGQGHGHSHSVPRSASSAAWMVIMGDGLHNFTDGLAIGASFASSLSVGLSTSVAVFCHELPHELGDFAVLLKAGMTIRHAIVCNVVSSVLGFAGMTIGVSVGNMESATAWIFAATAGIFLYIALVDMVPQLSPSAVDGNRWSTDLLLLLLHGSGIVCGLGVMLVIALYEDRLMMMVGDS